MKNNEFVKWKNTSFHSIDNIQPIGKRIRQARLFRQFNVVDFAKQLGVSRQSVHAFENDKKKPSSITMGKIVNLTGFPISFFLKPLPETSQVSVNFRSLKTSKVIIKDMVSVFSEFVEEFYLYLKNFIDYPRVNLPEIHGIIPGQIPADKIEDIACNLRTYWNIGYGPISNIIRLLEKNGVIVTRSYFGNEKVDACSYWSNFNRPILLLSSDKDCAVRNRFDAAHELGHLLLHRNLSQEQKKNKKLMAVVEKEANRFAGAFLLPYKSFPNEILTTSLNHFITLKERWKVSIGAMVYRCQDLGIITDTQVLNIRKQMATKKMLTREPLDDILEPETPSILMQSFKLLLENKVLSVKSILNDICMFSDDIESVACLPSGMLSYDDKVVPLLKLKK